MISNSALPFWFNNNSSPHDNPTFRGGPCVVLKFTNRVKQKSRKFHTDAEHYACIALRHTKVIHNWIFHHRIRTTGGTDTHIAPASRNSIHSLPHARHHRNDRATE
jgi:hypothetical protein